MTAVLLLAGLTTVLTAQDQSPSTPRDDSYQATYKQLPDTQRDRPNGEDLDARAMEPAISTPISRGSSSLKPRRNAPRTGAPSTGRSGRRRWAKWLSIGPVRSNWIQNGVRVTASDTGGLFSSTDGGRSWSDQKNDGINSYVVYAMTTTLGGLPNVS